MNELLELMARETPEEERRHKLFVSQVCLYLGLDSEDIRQMAWDIFGHQSRNPKWGAVLIMKNILGPQGEEQARDFARRMGFHP